MADYWQHVLKLNEWQKNRFASGIVSAMFNTVSGKRLAVLGVAYKKNTSDTRYSPAWDVCAALLKEQARAPPASRPRPDAIADVRSCVEGLKFLI